MRKAFIASLLFHFGIIIVAVVGIPVGEPLPVEMVDTIDVEIADLTVTTRNVKSDPKEEPEEKEPPKPPPAPKPRPAPPPEPTPEAAPEPEQKPEQVAEATPTEPTPEPEPKPEPEPQPTPPEKPAEEKVAAVMPKAKPRPKPPQKKDDFESMLNTLELDNDEPVQKTEKKSKEEDFVDSLDLDSLESPEKPKPQERSQLASIIGTQLTVSEKDAVRRQIEGCWNVPIGARNPEQLVVEIKIRVNRDRTVRQSEIVDKVRYAGDTFFRAMAESARRAVHNPRCSPLKLPPDKYDSWKEITLTFDPSKMVGR